MTDLVTIFHLQKGCQKRWGGTPGSSGMEVWRCDPGEIAVKEGTHSQIFRLFFNKKSRTSQVHVAPTLAVKVRI